MEPDIFFMPLGGGQRVGASCYFLRLGEANILLDAGIGTEKGLVFEPNLYALKTSCFLQSLNQIHQVFISHAHMDHVGYLLKLLQEADMPAVYMTELTALLAKYQLYDKIYMLGEQQAEKRRLAAQTLLERISYVSYRQSLCFGNYRATFFQAGHIPGAMMVLLETGRRKILYTGDYSLSETPLNGGCLVPEQEGIDTVILCGLHAKHPDYKRKENGLYQSVRMACQTAKRGRPVLCQIRQLSKGIEFLKAINHQNQEHIPIYLDRSVMSVIERLEQLGISVLTADNHVAGERLPDKPHLYLTSADRRELSSRYETIQVDFSLHEDFAEMKEFLKRINPRQAYLVHCAKEASREDQTIEQVLMLDGDCRTQITFAEEEEIYKL